MKVSTFIATSLDGFIARKDGSLDWLPGSDGEAVEDHGYDDFIETVDVLVMGRHTFEMVRSFGGEWPYAGRKVVVLSSGSIELPAELSGPVEQRSGEPAEIVRQLETEGFRHIYVDGGQTIQRFLRAAVLDRLIVTRIPVLLGSGIPLFGSLEQDVRWRHVRSESFESGMVQSEYELLRGSPERNK